jgi:hypothetical protein
MLDKKQVKIIREVSDGKRVFAPEDATGDEAEEAALKRFQPKAELVIEPGGLGYLEGVVPHNESWSAHSYLDHVRVKGLTAKGRRALEEARARTRLVALKCIYDRVGDSTTERLSFDEFKDATGLSFDEAHATLEYLDGKGFLCGGIELSHKGVVEIEQIIKDRKEATRVLGEWSREDEILVGEREARRYRVLRKIYDAAGGEVGNGVPYRKVQEELNLGDIEWWPTYYYLEAEGLIEEVASSLVGVTGVGVDEMERSKKSPPEGTEHFPATVIQYFNGPVGSVQTGAHSSSQVTQNFGFNTTEVLKLLEELRRGFQSLPEGEREQAIEVVDGLEEEIQSSNPRRGRIRVFLGQIGSFAANTASSVAADAIAKSLGM